MNISEQNSDSDKSGGEQEALMIHGHQVFSDPANEADPNVMKPGKTKTKFSRYFFPVLDVLTHNFRRVLCCAYGIHSLNDNHLDFELISRLLI